MLNVNTASKAQPALTSWKHPLQATIPEIRNASLSAVYYGQRRSGDFYDFVSIRKDKVLFGLFDVAGELQHNRGIMIDLQRTFRNWGAKLFKNEAENETDSLIKLWSLLNRATMKSAGGVCACAAFLGCYDDQAGIICYVNAGHTQGIVRHKQTIRKLEATAFPLGLFSHSAPDASMVALNPGDALLLVSKGVVEARYREEEYGLQQAGEYLDHTRAESAHEVCVGLLDQLRRFMHAAPTHDDVTALALVRSA